MRRKNILIIKYGALGDVLRTSYILPALKSKYKRARIYWITSKEALELLKQNPYIYKIASLKEKKALSALSGICYDHIISLDDEKEPAGLAGRLKAKKLTGAFVRLGKVFYTPDSSPWFDMGLISRFGKTKADKLKAQNKLTHNAILGRMLGVKITKPYFFNDPACERVERKLFGKYKNKKLIGLNLHAGKKWPSKSLRVQEARALANELLDKGYAVMVLGGADDKAYNDKISKGLRGQDLIYPAAVDLRRFAARIKQLDLLITSDSLALHLAIAQRIKTVSFFSPTSAAEIDDFGAGVKVVSTSPDYCSYKPDADNSSITSVRIMKALNKIGY
jgi:heptosyltransferase-2